MDPREGCGGHTRELGDSSEDREDPQGIGRHHHAGYVVYKWRLASLRLWFYAGVGDSEPVDAPTKLQPSVKKEEKAKGKTDVRQACRDHEASLLGDSFLRVYVAAVPIIVLVQAKYAGVVVGASHNTPGGLFLGKLKAATDSKPLGLLVPSPCFAVGTYGKCYPE